MPDSITNDSESIRLTDRDEKMPEEQSLELALKEPPAVGERPSMDTLGSSLSSINDDDPIPRVDSRGPGATFERRQAQMLAICSYPRLPC